MSKIPTDLKPAYNQVINAGLGGSIPANPRRTELVVFLPDNIDYSISLGNPANVLLVAGERITIPDQKVGLSFVLNINDASPSGRVIAYESSYDSDFGG